MFAIELAKLPPPKPAVAAITQKTQYGVSGSLHDDTRRAASGSAAAPALIIVQLRPPNFGTANV